MKKVRYHHKNRSYTVDSYFPRFRGKYCWVIGETIQLDRYYGKHASPRERQEIADSLLETIYELKEEARRLCERY
jgi:hypothetical protein